MQSLTSLRCLWCLKPPPLPPQPFTVFWSVSNPKITCVLQCSALLKSLIHGSSHPVAGPRPTLADQYGDANDEAGDDVLGTDL